ncbi:MAG: DUF3574 domain-containing protein [Chloroflexota bacterium]|nr:DUF3574 domain-containing protein [Chloroflexota bacterium]
MNVFRSIFAAGPARSLGLALAVFVGGASTATYLPFVGHQGESEVAETCELVAPEAEAEPWVRTELFFGTARPDGTAVTETEWRQFLEAAVTPRFPDGLTVLNGNGQWQEEDGDIIQERSKLVVLLYPREAVDESNDEIEAIRTAYETRFQQQSVLRADDDRPVCTSF